MSAFTEALTKDAAPSRCSVAAAIQAVDEESRADLTAWETGEVSYTDIDVWNGLQALGQRVGKQTVGRHRRGQCGCA